MVILGVTGCSVDIIHDVNESEANSVLAALHARGIAAQKTRSAEGREPSYVISVPRSDAMTAWQVLRTENLPRPRQEGLGDVFGEPGLVPTATQERALMHHALSGELSRTLQAVEGVIEARVHVVLPERDPLAPADAPAPSPKAAVLLRAHPQPALDRKQVQELVAGSVRDLKPEAVAVVVVTAKPPRPAPSSTAKAPPALARVGPFRVDPSSRSLLLVTLTGALALLVVLGSAVLLVLRRNRALSAHLSVAEAQRPAASSGTVQTALSVVSRAASRTSHTNVTGGERDRS
jgi:type III secretion protein J